MTEFNPDNYPHPPGSSKAVADGCICNIMANRDIHRQGYVDEAGNLLYLVDIDCPIHGGDKPDQDPGTICYKAKEYFASKGSPA